MDVLLLKELKHVEQMLDSKQIGINTLNISYNSKNTNNTLLSYEKLLSNLFPYEFQFRNFSVGSIEGVLQGLKHKDSTTQRLVFKYSGNDAYHLRCAVADDWRKSGILYFQGKEINRFGIDYQRFLDELYTSVLQNPLFCNALINSYPYSLYHDGNNSNKETVLTPYEYIGRLYILRYYLLYKLNEKVLERDLNDFDELVLKKGEL